MNGIAIAWIRRDAQRTGALNDINVSDLAAVQHAQVHRFRVTHQEFEHDCVSDRLKSSELHGRLGQSKELWSQVIVGLDVGLLNVSQLLQRIKYAMHSGAGKRYGARQLLKGDSLLLGAFLHKIL